MVSLGSVTTLLHLALLALTIFALSRFVPAVRIKGPTTAVVVAIVFSVLNFLLAWLIKAVLFVPALFTLGVLFLFLPFIVNGVLLWLTDKLMASFEITSFRGLFICAAAITLVNALFYAHLFQAAWGGAGLHGHTRWI
jgi:putative membrane protein